MGDIFDTLDTQIADSSPKDIFDTVEQPASPPVKRDIFDAASESPVRPTEQYQFSPPTPNQSPESQPTPQSTTVAGSFAGGVARNIGPAAAFAAAAPHGAAVGTAIGAAIPVLGETGIGEAGGAFIGGLVSGALAAWAAHKAQSVIADAVAPDSIIGSKVEAQQEKEHPIATTVGSLLAMGKPNPLKVVRAAETLTSAEGRAALLSLAKSAAEKDGIVAWREATDPAIQKKVADVLEVAQSGGANAAFNAYDQIQSGNYSVTELLKAAGEGALFNSPWIHAKNPATETFDETVNPKSQEQPNEQVQQTQSEVVPPQGSNQPDAVGSGNRDTQVRQGGNVEAGAGSAPPEEVLKKPSILKPEDLVPALQNDTGIMAGKAGDTHAAIRERAMADPESTPEHKAAVNEAFINDAGHVFLGPDNAVYSREEAAKALGETKPLKSARLNELQKPPQPITPQPEWQVSVQSEQGGIPGTGYVQIDDISNGQNNWSKSPQTLAKEGVQVPDFSKLPQGKYTYKDAVDLLSKPSEPAKTVDTSKIHVTSEAKALAGVPSSSKTLEPVANLGEGLPEGEGSTPEQVTEAIKGIDTRGFKVNIISRDNAVKLTKTPEASGYGGFYYNGEVYVVHDNIAPRNIEGTRQLLREEVAHGLLKTEDGGSLVNDALAKGKLQLTDGEKQTLRDAGYQEHQLLDEFIAKSARENRPWWNEAVLTVKSWLAKAGLQLSNEETARLLLRQIHSGKSNLGDLAPGPSVPNDTTQVMGQEKEIGSREHLTPETRQQSIDAAKSFFDEASIPVTLETIPDPRRPKETFKLWVADTGFDLNPEARKLVDILKRELPLQTQPGRSPEQLASLLRSITYNIETGRFAQKLPNGQDVVSLDLRRELSQLVQSDASWKGQMLGALSRHSVDLQDVVHDPQLHLQRTWYENFGGPEVDSFFKRVVSNFRGLFTSEEIEKSRKDVPALGEFLDRMIAQNFKDEGGRVYRKVQAQWTEKFKPKLSQLERDAKINEAAQTIIEQAKKRFGIEPKKSVKEDISPYEKLLLMVDEKTADKVSILMKGAVADAEYNAGRRAMEDAAKTEPDPVKRQDVIEHLALMEGDEKILPLPEYVEKGMSLPEYANWKTVRDNWFDYSPITERLIQQVLADDFKGTRFNKKDATAKPADTRIDLSKLATEPDKEVQRVLDAYYANLDATMEINNASEATRQRIRADVEKKVAEQLESRRKSFLDNFFNKTAYSKQAKTGSERLRQLINAGVEKDERFKSDRVNRLIKKISSEYVDAKQVDALAQSTRAEKFNWIDQKSDEIAKAESFNSATPETRDYLDAVTRSYLAERLQASEEKLTRSFLKGSDADYVKTVIDPNSRERSLNAAKSKVEGLLRAGAFDTSMVEKIASKSSLSKLTPSISSIAKSVLNTPKQNQKMFVDSIVEGLVSSMNIDPAQAEKFSQILYKSLEPKMAEARKRAFDKAVSDITPKEREVLPRSNTKLWERLEHLNNVGGLDTAAALEQIAKGRGLTPPTAKTVAELKSMADKEQDLRTPNPAEVAAINSDTSLTPEQKQANIAERTAELRDMTRNTRAQLIREMAVTWSRIFKPLGWKHWFAGREIMKNNVKALNEYETLDMLTKVGFPFRILTHITTQLLLHTPTRAFARARLIRIQEMEKAGADSRTAFTLADPKYWQDVARGFVDSYTATIAALKPALISARAELYGRGETRNVDRLMSGVNALERINKKAQEEMKEGRPWNAAILHFVNAPRLIQWYISAVDHFQGKPTEYQEIINQVEIQMREDGRTRAEIDQFKNDVFASMRDEFPKAVADTAKFFEARGIDKSPKEIEEEANNLVTRRIYEQMQRIGLPADAFEQDINLLKSTVSWQERTTRGAGGIMANVLRGVSDVGENMGIPLSIARLSNAIGTGINYALMNTPAYKLAEWGGSGDVSPWFKSRLDREQRLAQSVIGTLLGGAAVAMVASGAVTVVSSPPQDKRKREEFYAQGHRPGTVEFNLPDGSFIPVSLTVGPVALAAPYFMGAGAVADLTKSREQQQTALNEEAVRKGLPPGKIRPVDFADVLYLAGQTALGTITSARTASGLAGSLMEQGVPNARKAAASFISPLVPLLPAFQEVSRMLGVSMDSKLASVWDYLVPLPTSGARAVNMLGDPVMTPNAIQRVLQVITAGTYPLAVNPDDVKANSAYAALFATDFRPPSINTAKGYNINGTFRPMTDAELEKYTVNRGEYLKESLSGLGANATKQQVQAAYQDANARALADVGAAATAARAQGGGQAGGAPVGPSSGSTGARRLSLKGLRPRSHGRRLKFSRFGKSKGQRLSLTGNRSRLHTSKLRLSARHLRRPRITV